MSPLSAFSTRGSFAELTSAADFAAVASPGGRISVIGFGSLFSERSARSTFPELEGFRVAALRGFRRVFAHVAPIFFGIAVEATKVPAFIERENEFRFLAVVPEGLDGVPFPNPAVICARYSDEEYFQVRCKGSKEIYNQHYGRYAIDKYGGMIFYRVVYILGIGISCKLEPPYTLEIHRGTDYYSVLTAKNLGEPTYSNFLDHTYLGDRKTTIREYLATAGAGIMEEEPPESLKSRYGG